MSLGDHVLCLDSWEFGVRHNYDRIPGTVCKIYSDGVIEVVWADGHTSIHSDDELRPVQH